MSKFLKPAAGLGLIFLAFVCAGCRNLDEIKALQIEDIPFTTVKDGVYQGFQDNWMVTAKVEVTMSSGTMTDARLLEHHHGPNHGADAILGRVLEKQSLVVDAVSGASYSSKVVLKALELALRKGL
jgi:uncharacterized protein with FMN-binding domain